MHQQAWLPRCLGTALTAVLLLASLRAGIAAALPSAQSPPPTAAAVADPLGRNTPLGTITGFSSAVRREDFATAQQYMQLTAAQRPNAETLALELTTLMDHYYRQPITALSALPEGTQNDGLPPDRERITLTIDGKAVDLQLVRVNNPHGGLIWLISSETLARVPSLRGSLQSNWVQTLLPESLSEHSLFGVSLAQWTVWAGSIGAPLVVLWLASGLVIRVARRSIRDPARRQLVDAWHAGLSWPTILTGTLLVHGTVMRFIGFSLAFRIAYARFVIVVAVLVLAWLTWRLLTLAAMQIERAARRRGHAGTESLMLLGERLVKVLIVTIAILAILSIAGVNTSTALAGLGIGGIAVALGAQKSVENLLGGVFLLTDKALAVGDTCRISDRIGSIEDITLRSVRLRTAEQTLLSIPAGVLAQATIENFATRDKMPVQTTLRLHYGTTAQQLRSVLKAIQGTLAGHPQIEGGTSHVRLVAFGAQAIELELFAYILTRDGAKFLAARENLLLQIAEIVEDSGARFAQPT